MQRKFQNARQGRGQVVADTDKVEHVDLDDLSSLNIKPLKFNLLKEQVEEKDEEQHRSTPKPKAASPEVAAHGEAAAPGSQRAKPRVIGRMSKAPATVAESLVADMFNGTDTWAERAEEAQPAAPRAPRAPKKQALTTPTSHPAPTLCARRGSGATPSSTAAT